MNKSSVKPRKVLFRRVGIFHARERHVRSEDGEWFRDDEKSTKSLTEQINEFLDNNGVEVVFISNPDVRLAAKSDSAREYYTSVSIIYVPEELISDCGEELTEENVVARDIPLIETPRDIYEILGRSLTEQLNQNRSK